VFATEAEWLFLVVNFVQFDNDFTGLDVEIGMFFQCTFKSFRYSVSAHAWLKCFHTCRHNAKHGFLFFSSWGFDQAVFLVTNLLTAALTNSSALFVQNFVLIGYRMNSTNAVVCEVSMFPADHRKRTGMSRKSTFHKFSGESGQAGVLKRNNFAGASSTL